MALLIYSSQKRETALTDFEKYLLKKRKSDAKIIGELRRLLKDKETYIKTLENNTK